MHENISVRDAIIASTAQAADGAQEARATDSAYDAEWTKITNAAASLEDIVVMLKAAVTDLRDNAQRLSHVPSDEDHVARRLVYDSYARVFTLRRKLGRVVASLGSGAPARLAQYDAAYDKLVQD